MAGGAFAVACLIGAAPLFVDLPNGERGTVFAIGFGTDCGCGAAATGRGAGCGGSRTAGAGILANLMSMTGTLCCCGCRSAANTAAAVIAACRKTEATTP